MTNPYDPYSGQPPGQGADPYAGPQQPYSQPTQQLPAQADAAAPTQFVPVQQFAPVQQPGPQIPQQPYYGAQQQAQQQWPQQQAQPQQQWPQQQPYPQPYPQPQPPYGVPTQQQAYPPYGAPQQPYGGYPAPMSLEEAKAQRGTGAKVASAVFGTVLGRLAIIALIAVGIGLYHFASGDGSGGDGSQAGQSATTQSTASATSSAGSVATDAPTETSTGIVASQVDIDALKQGDCFDAPAASTGIESFEVVSCTQEHDSQVYGTATITGIALPDASTLDKDASADCSSLAKLDLNSGSLPSDAETSYYVPEDENSFDSGFNFIICTIHTPGRELKKSYYTGS